jgi:hypothetical protein
VHLGDVVYFDDPRSEVDASFPTFQTLGNHAIIDRHFLSPDRLVIKTDNEYIDFRLEYSSPLDINFNTMSFIRSIRQPSKDPGAPLFQMITKFVAAAMDAHPELLDGPEGRKGRPSESETPLIFNRNSVPSLANRRKDWRTAIRAAVGIRRRHPARLLFDHLMTDDILRVAVPKSGAGSDLSAANVPTDSKRREKRAVHFGSKESMVVTYDDIPFEFGPM